MIPSATLDFSEQRAIVTGGTRGIGAAISRALLAAGAEVTAIYRADDAQAQAFRDGCTEAQQQRLATVRLDVADHEAVHSFFERWHGPLQVLINNAGVRDDALLGMMSKKSWDRVLTVNLGGAFYLSKYAVRLMLSQRYGRVVNVGSPSASHGVAGQANYAAAKAGLAGLTRSLAREVATRGITVNLVVPGYVDTDLIADLPGPRREQLRKQVPMQRFGNADEIAAAVLFLASEQASYVTGATLPVTGGV